MKVSIHGFLQLLWLKLREEDKIKHMVWSFWLTLAALGIWSPSLALAAVLALGLAKEIWDSRYGSGFCWFDMAGNVLGILSGLLCGLLLTLLFF